MAARKEKSPQDGFPPPHDLVDEEHVKKCSTCEDPKPLQHFTYDKKKGRYRSRCKKCRSAFRRKKEKTDRIKNIKRHNPGIHPEVLEIIRELSTSEDRQEDFYKELEAKKAVKKMHDC